MSDNSWWGKFNKPKKHVELTGPIIFSFSFHLLGCFGMFFHDATRLFSHTHTRTHPPFWCYLQCIRNSAYIEQQHQTHARFHVSNKTKMHGIELIYYLTNFLAFMTRCDSMLILKFVMASVRAFALHQMWLYKWSYYNRQRWFWFMYIFFIKMVKMCIHNSNYIQKMTFCYFFYLAILPLMQNISALFHNMTVQFCLN